MATPQGSDERNTSDESDTSIQVVEQRNSNFNEEEVKKIQEAIERLRQRGRPVNILVTGPTGAGKSTLINDLMGDNFAEEGAGATSVQSEVEVHEGEYEGIDIKVYDTPGFGDTEGRSDAGIVREIAQANKFDLILICVRMDSRADRGVQDMFTSLGDMINKEMWERTVIVLTFANAFLQLRSIRKSPNKAEIVRNEIEDFKRHVHDYLRDTLKKETIDEIPFCIAGDDEKERRLPTTDDWLKELWGQCVRRCSEDARELLTAISRITLKEVGALSGGIAVGAITGGFVGKVIGDSAVTTRTGIVIGGGLAIIVESVIVIKRKADSKK